MNSKQKKKHKKTPYFQVGILGVNFDKNKKQIIYYSIDECTPSTTSNMLVIIQLLLLYHHCIHSNQFLWLVVLNSNKMDQR